MIEGLPGSGKTTLAGKLVSRVLEHGVSAACHLENDLDNPIELPNRSRGLAEIIRSFATGNTIASQWEKFAATAESKPIRIMESRFWQNALMFMLLAGQDELSIERAHDELCKTINALSPVLIWLRPTRWSDLKASNAEKTSVDPEWAKTALTAVTQQQWFRNRQLTDRADALGTFFEYWLQFSERLFRRFPGRKCELVNPQLDWDGATQAAFAFLQI